MMYTEVKDCMKKICESLRDHAMRIIRFKNKKIMLLIKEQQESHENTKICYICEETFDNKYLKDKKYCKVRDHCHYTREYRGAAHSICNLKYSEPKRTPIVFHNGSDYDYHFIKKESAKEFNKQFTCLGENTEKYLTFTVAIKKKVTRVIKMEKKLKCYILQLIDSARFMASLSSNLVNNLSDRIHKIKCKSGHDDKKCETYGIKYKYCECFL